MDYPYLYETHCHTTEGSKCARSGGADMAAYFHSLGYTGIFITDHFFNGNTTVPAELPWEERVELFCRGYENAAKEGKKLGIDVFFAWEYSYGWCHLLTYNLSKDWLLAHPDVLDWNVLDYLDRVHADGGFVVHAHPFREKVELVSLMPWKVDAIEAPNAAREERFNTYARRYAEMLELPVTAGSDIHRVNASRLCGVSVQERFAAPEEYSRAVRESKVRVFDRTMQK